MPEEKSVERFYLVLEDCDGAIHPSALFKDLSDAERYINKFREEKGTRYINLISLAESYEDACKRGAPWFPDILTSLHIK